MYDNVSALEAYGIGMHATAYNIANINTQNFQALDIAYINGPADSVRAHVTQPDAGLPAGYGQDRVTLFEGSVWNPLEGYAVNNTVDVARDTVAMIEAQRGFEANVQAIRGRSELNDAALGLVVDRRI